MPTSLNPLLETKGLPRFDLIQPAHVVPAMREVIEQATSALEQLEANPPIDWTLIERLNDIEESLHRTWGVVHHLLGVQNSDDLRAAHEEMQPAVVALSLRFGQSEAIFHALEKIQKRPDYMTWDSARRRTIELRLRGMRHSGIGLSGEKRDRYNAIAERLSKLSTEFSNHVLDATKEFALELREKKDMEGLPDSFLSMASASFNKAHPDQAGDAENGPWRVGLDLPFFLPFMQHAKNRQRRREIYLAYIQRASSGNRNNEPIIEEILKLRLESAKLLGYESHAKLSLSEKMATSVESAEQLLEELRVSSFDPAQTEMEELRAFAKDRGEESELMHWDLAFWAERLREERFAFTDEELRPYFPLPRVLDGLFGLATRLFGVKIEAAQGETPTWHEDVRFFRIIGENGEHIASFFLDPYSRPENKRGGAWMDDCVGRRRTEQGLQLPVAYLVCNSTPPVGDRPSLMSFREVETLFHEFGHGLQHMLTDVDHADVSGINGVEWDAVELPSQFMENWCYHRPTLMGMTRHVDTGEPLPDDLFGKIKRARTYRAASDMLRQLRFSFLDLELHHRYDPNDDTTSVFDVQKRVDEKTTVISALKEDRFLCSFAHIFAGGYSAGYYSYKWAEVLSADAFSAFEEAGLDNDAAVKETGRRFRETILALGGSQTPLEVFQAFRGRDPSTEALLRHAGLAA